MAHLLVRLKRKLQLPGHSMVVSSRSGESRFINNGAYFTTDYGGFEALLVQAKTLERAGEWAFAEREYLRAFKLFRGEPFKKMYDNWSENMRRVILNKLETEAIHFVQECLKRGNKKDARKVLGKVIRIIPNSDESMRILQIL
ncbi:MAG: BTAD domain-containing putative transcriptional regulator [bacterium]